MYEIIFTLNCELIFAKVVSVRDFETRHGEVRKAGFKKGHSGSLFNVFF